MSLPPRPPPGSVDELVDENHRRGISVGPRANWNGSDGDFDLGYAVAAISSATGLEARLADAA